MATPVKPTGMVSSTTTGFRNELNWPTRQISTPSRLMGTKANSAAWASVEPSDSPPHSRLKPGPSSATILSIIGAAFASSMPAVSSRPLAWTVTVGA